MFDQAIDSLSIELIISMMNKSHLVKLLEIFQKRVNINHEYFLWARLSREFVMSLDQEKDYFIPFVDIEVCRSITMKMLLGYDESPLNAPDYIKDAVKKYDLEKYRIRIHSMLSLDCKFAAGLEYHFINIGNIGLWLYHYGDFEKASLFLKYALDNNLMFFAEEYADICFRNLDKQHVDCFDEAAFWFMKASENREDGSAKKLISKICQEIPVGTVEQDQISSISLALKFMDENEYKNYLQTRSNEREYCNHHCIQLTRTRLNDWDYKKYVDKRSTEYAHNKSEETTSSSHGQNCETNYLGISNKSMTHPLLISFKPNNNDNTMSRNNNSNNGSVSNSSNKIDHYSLLPDPNITIVDDVLSSHFEGLACHIERECENPCSSINLGVHDQNMNNDTVTVSSHTGYNHLDSNTSYQVNEPSISNTSSSSITTPSPKKFNRSVEVYNEIDSLPKEKRISDLNMDELLQLKRYLPFFKKTMINRERALILSCLSNQNSFLKVSDLIHILQTHFARGFNDTGAKVRKALRSFIAYMLKCETRREAPSESSPQTCELKTSVSIHCETWLSRRRNPVDGYRPTPYPGMRVANDDDGEDEYIPNAASSSKTRQSNINAKKRRRVITDDDIASINDGQSSLCTRNNSKKPKPQDQSHLQIHQPQKIIPRLPSISALSHAEREALIASKSLTTTNSSLSSTTSQSIADQRIEISHLISQLRTNLGRLRYLETETASVITDTQHLVHELEQSYIK